MLWRFDGQGLAKGPKAIQAEVLPACRCCWNGAIVPRWDHSTIQELLLAGYRNCREFLRKVCES